MKTKKRNKIFVLLATIAIMIMALGLAFYFIFSTPGNNKLNPKDTRTAWNTPTSSAFSAELGEIGKMASQLDYLKQQERNLQRLIDGRNDTIREITDPSQDWLKQRQLEDMKSEQTELDNIQQKMRDLEDGIVEKQQMLTEPGLSQQAVSEGITDAKNSNDLDVNPEFGPKFSGDLANKSNEELYQNLATLGDKAVQLEDQRKEIQGKYFGDLPKGETGSGVESLGTKLSEENKVSVRTGEPVTAEEAHAYLRSNLSLEKDHYDQYQDVKYNADIAEKAMERYGKELENRGISAEDINSSLGKIREENGYREYDKDILERVAQNSVTEPAMDEIHRLLNSNVNATDEVRGIVEQIPDYVVVGDRKDDTKLAEGGKNDNQSEETPPAQYAQTQPEGSERTTSDASPKPIVEEQQTETPESQVQENKSEGTATRDNFETMGAGGAVEEKALQPAGDTNNDGGSGLLLPEDETNWERYSTSTAGDRMAGPDYWGDWDTAQFEQEHPFSVLSPESPPVPDSSQPQQNGGLPWGKQSPPTAGVSSNESDVPPVLDKPYSEGQGESDSGLFDTSSWADYLSNLFEGKEKKIDTTPDKEGATPQNDNLEDNNGNNNSNGEGNPNGEGNDSSGNTSTEN